VAVDGVGNVYVADSQNNLIRKVTPGGVVTTLAGTAGSYGSENGTGADARLGNVYGVAVDGDGNVYAGDEYNGTVRKVTPGGVVTRLAGSGGEMSWGFQDAIGPLARFSGPTGVAVDGDGNVYVADSYNNLIRKVTPAG
jgi:sugar lactone lactonase YvrE